MTHFVHSSIRSKAPHPVAQAAAMLVLSTACHMAQAAVVYLPNCVTCTVDSAPPAGDEWVIQGSNVSFGTDNLRSEGLFTNKARTLTNGQHLIVVGGFGNTTRLNNVGSIGIGGPGFSNTSTGQITNTGDFTVYTTLSNAGRLINNGSFTNFDGFITNKSGATFTNNATYLSRGGRLTNEAGAVINNYGQMTGNVGATLNNLGIVNNRAGTLSLSQINNSNQIINSAGATLTVGNTLVNESGAKLVNRGTVNLTDSRLTLKAGSDYDFRGGTLNINTMGKVQLDRDFTIGDSKGGTVHLGFDGTIVNNATLKIMGTQTMAGNISNASGTVNNSGTWTAQGVVFGGDIVNKGTFNVEGIVRSASFTQSAGKTVVKGDAAFGQTDVRGTLDVQGGILKTDTLGVKGSLLASGGASLNLGLVNVASTGWLSLGDATLTVSEFYDDSLASASKWKTSQASLVFEGEGQHTFGVGLASHRWGSLTLDAAGSYSFVNGAALTVGEFIISNGDLSLLDAVSGNTTIYYDARLEGNAYLGGGTYSFGQGSGKLMASAESLVLAVPEMGLPSVTAVPEAEEWMLAIAGLSVLGLMRRRLAARA